MGSDGKKTHESYTITPADAGEDLLEDVDAEVDAETQAQVGKLEHTLELIKGVPAASDKVDEDLAWLVGCAHDEVDALDVDDGDKAGWHAAVAAAAADALAGLPDEQLAQLAADKGFAHPTLVSAAHNETGGHGALVHWLNPAYPDDAASKTKIHAKADERYAQLAAGQIDTIGGQSLADVQAADAALHPPGPPAEVGWQATPAEVAEAIAGVNQALVDLYAPASVYAPGPDDDGGLQAVLDAEATVAGAQCPEMGEGLATVKAAAAGVVSKQLDGLPSSTRNAMIDHAVAHAVDQGAMTEAQASWLDRPSQLALLRAATDPGVHQNLEDLAVGRHAQVEAATSAAAAATAAGAVPASPEAATIAAWAAAHADAAAAKQAVGDWALQVANPKLVSGAVGGPASGWALTQQLGQDTTQWRAWAKDQPLPVLRAAAGQLGMNTAGATRAEIQNYIAAGWDPQLSKSKVQAAATKKATAAAAKKASKPSLSGTSTTAAGTDGSSKTAVSPPPQAASPAGGSWAAKHANVVAALKAHQAVTADVPDHRPHEQITALQLSKGHKAPVGGMHPKTFHTDQDGGTWLHKADSKKGARATAEAAAARLHNLAGLRTPPVYVRKVDGKVGSLQQWIPNAGPLSASPTEWSQADVDSIVRFHVAAWTCSNYDGNPANVLRTPSGGLTPIDHGQAFRYFGADRAAVDYDPNGHSYGQPPPVFVTAYKAAGAGKLAPGVRVRPEAALPTIKAFEAIPDATVRAELAPVATEGLKAGLAWVPRMRKAAQKRTGKTNVSDSEIVEEFLDQAVARKNGLRATFAAMFAGAGLDAKGLTKVA